MATYNPQFNTPAYGQGGASTPSYGGGLAGQAAQQNIAAAPGIAELSKLVADINQSAYLSAPGRQEQLGTIQNQLAGNLSDQTLDQTQQRMAELYGARGASFDAPALNSALQRAWGLNREDLIGQGQSAMNAMYAQMPQFNAQDQMVTPGLLEQQQNNQAMRAQASAQLAQQAKQFDISTAEGARQFNASLAQKAAESSLQAQQFQTQLAESQRQYDLTHSSTVANQIATLQEDARQANLQAAMDQQKMMIASSQFQQQFGQNAAQQAEAQRQYNTSLANTQSQFGRTMAQNQAELYAQTYGALPGYNEYGMYTGQNTVPVRGATPAAASPNTQTPATSNLPAWFTARYSNPFTSNWNTWPESGSVFRPSITI
jgi:hypothetical protein